MISSFVRKDAVSWLTTIYSYKLQDKIGTEGEDVSWRLDIIIPRWGNDWSQLMNDILVWKEKFS